MKSRNNDFDVGEREFLKKQQQKILDNADKKDQTIFDFLKEIAFFTSFEKKDSSKTKDLKILLSQIVQIDDGGNIDNVDYFEETCKDAYIDTDDLIIHQDKEIWTGSFFLKYFTQEKEVQTLFYDELTLENRKDSDSLEQEKENSIEEYKIDQNVIFQATKDQIESDELLKKRNLDQNKFKNFDSRDVQRIFDYIKEIEEFLTKNQISISKMAMEEKKTSLEVNLEFANEIGINLENCQKVSNFLKEMNNVNNQSQLALKIENLEAKLDLEELEKIKSVYQYNFEQIKEKFLQFFKETIKVEDEFLSIEEFTQISMNSIASNSIQPSPAGVSYLKRKGSVAENSIFLSVQPPTNKSPRKSMMKLMSNEKKSLEKSGFLMKSSRLEGNEINNFDEKNDDPQFYSNINNEIFDDPSIIINPENSMIANNDHLNVNFFNNLPTSTPHRKNSSFKPRKSIRLSILFDKGQEIKSLLSNSEINMKEVLEKETQLKTERNENNEEMTNLINQVGNFLSKKKRWSRIQGFHSEKCASFLIKLHNSQLKSSQSSSLNIILKIISQTYTNILKAHQTKQSTLNPLFFIFYEFMLQKSGGSKERTESKITRIVQSFQSLSGNYRIKMFMKLLSLTKTESISIKEKKKKKKMK